MAAAPDGKRLAVPPGPAVPTTDMGWEVYPDGLRAGLLRLQRDYAPPWVVIAENGAAYDDPPDPDGRLRDERRLAYLRDHLRSAHAALAAGVPLRGYFLWSLLDNFEWAHGYTKKFGLFALEPRTLTRLPKDSAYWYRATVAANAVPGDGASFNRGDARAFAL
jgi:beta-glucosidase